MPEILEPIADVEFPTPKIEQQLTPIKLDEYHQPIADVEFPMPKVETVFYDDAARQRYEAAAKAEAAAAKTPAPAAEAKVLTSQGTVETKVVKKAAATTKAKAK